MAFNPPEPNKDGLKINYDDQLLRKETGKKVAQNPNENFVRYNFDMHKVLRFQLTISTIQRLNSFNLALYNVNY